MRILVLLATLLLSFGQALADEWKVDKPSTVTLYVFHPAHDVVSVSTAPRGNLKFSLPTSGAPDFSVLKKQFIQVDWKTFDSGNDSRDGNIRNFVDAGKYGTVTFAVKSVGTATELSSQSWSVPLTGKLYVKGTKVVVETVAKIEVLDGGKVRIRAHIESKLTDHGIEPPSVVFISAKDPYQIDVDLVLSK